MKLLSYLLASALLALTAASVTEGCSSNASSCDSSACNPGNKCVNDGKTGEKCRLLCNAQRCPTGSDASCAGCPFDYTCTLAPDGHTSYCAADKPEIKYTNGAGVWGTHCLPSNGGLNTNTDCDQNQNFWCYAKSPTDGAAYCTQYQCADDTDCTGGYWCSTINIFPDARKDKHVFSGGLDNRTTSACLKRDYCAPCKTDIDCPQEFTSTGGPTHCVQGTDGASFCTSECSKDANCRLDAACQTNDAIGAKVCMPRAGVCKGDGTLCSPCYSDGDCPNGFCVEQAYSHEKYCTQKSGVACTVTNNKLVAQCPKVPRADNDAISCATTSDYPTIPKDQCFGLVQFGTDPSTGDPSYVDGCWTIQRN